MDTCKKNIFNDYSNQELHVVYTAYSTCTFYTNTKYSVGFPLLLGKNVLN